MAEDTAGFSSSRRLAVAQGGGIIVTWLAADGSGELLFPQALPDGDVIDLGRITALGTWAYALLRARPGRDVVGASPELKRQLEAAGLSLRWRDPAVRIGVTNLERDDLFGVG